MSVSVLRRSSRRHDERDADDDERDPEPAEERRTLAESDEHFPVNIGNPGEFTILELAQAVLKVTGSSSEIVFEALPVDDPQIRQPDITRAKQLLGWEPEIDLEEGLRRMLPTWERVHA